MKSKLLIILTSLLFITGCVTVYNPATGKKETYLFDDKAEISWGDAMAQQIISENKMLQDPEVIEYVQNLGDQIAQESHRNYLRYHFYVIDDDTINAFAAPGGHIFVYRGLLQEVSEQELAFVLAHEIGHVCARHSLKRLGASLGFTLLTTILLRNPDQESTRKLTNQLYNLIALGYSRSDEYQADYLGLQYTAEAGYNPRASISLFKLFNKMEEKHGSQPLYLRTHPVPDKRIENVKKEMEKLGY